MICGKGLNDAGYQTQRFEIVDGKKRLVWKCPVYALWVGMITRCYSKYFQSKQPTYENCDTAAAWLKFSYFRDWLFEEPLFGYLNAGEGDLQLDKDLIVVGNTTYSADTCALVPKYVNTALAYSKKGITPMGVTKRQCRDLYEASCNFMGVKEYLGSFDNAFDAHVSWQRRKIRNLESILKMYRESDFFNSRVYEGLEKRVCNIKMDIYNGVETTKL